MNDNDYAMLKLHAMNGAQKAADGVTALLENLRYDYLEGKEKLSFPEAMGPRHFVGPHPQYGAPDGK